jgi:hypothetical protein
MTRSVVAMSIAGVALAWRFRRMIVPAFGLFGVAGRLLDPRSVTKT